MNISKKLIIIISVGATLILLTAGGYWIAKNVAVEETSSNLLTQTAFAPIAEGRRLQEVEYKGSIDQDALLRIKFAYSRKESAVSYIAHGKQYDLPEADLSTFIILSGSIFETEPFAIDKNNVYYLGKVIPGADPSTFRVFGGGSYSADARGAYWEGAPIPEADVATFVVVDNDASLTLAKDKNYNYCSGIAYPKDSLKCVSTPVSSLNAETYTDSELGFSFYYPKGWRVVKENGLLKVMNPQDPSINQYFDGTWVTLKVSDGNSVITSDAANGRYKFTYDTSHRMKVSENGYDGSEGAEMEVSPVKRTLGGLYWYSGKTRYGTVVVPLPGPKMLVATSPSGASSFVSALIGTLTLKGQDINLIDADKAFKVELEDRYYQQDICRQNGIKDLDCPANR